MTASVPLRGRAAILPKMNAVRRQFPIARRAGAAAVLALALAACTPAPQSSMDQVRSRGELRVVMLTGPTSYYQGAHGPEGFEYRLASAFAQRLGVKLTVQAVGDTAAVRAALRHGRADLAAAQISVDPKWLSLGLPTDTYQELPQVVIQGRGRTRAHDLAGLHAAPIVVLASSPQAAMLRSLRDDAGYHELTWKEIPEGGSTLLKLVTDGEAEYAVMDAAQFEFAQHLYPEASVAFKLADERPLQWVVRTDAADLVHEANLFLAEVKGSGELVRIAQTASAESGDFDYSEARRFRTDIADRLPEIRSLFEEAASVTGIDWRLLAAVGYQESRWQMQAASGDGARGIMMLTNDAASTVGVTDRGDQRQNILGGAKYLAQAFAIIPKRIPEPERTWFALAAYNAGYGHLEDARVLAQMRGKNPDSWDDVHDQLPLLAEETWFTRLKRGYARGWEPARFVDQVRQYLAVLEWGDNTPNPVAQAHALKPVTDADSFE
jgi:membrane-bound lytic murein transglycosylase F